MSNQEKRKGKYRNKTVVELLELENQYRKKWSSYGGLFEGDKSINKISNAIVHAFSNENEETYLLKINGSIDEPILVKYKGENVKIFNFSFDYVVNFQSDELVEAVKKYRIAKLEELADCYIEIVKLLVNRECEKLSWV